MTFDFFDFWMFLLLFVVHNCKNEEINVAKSDFFICSPKFCINHAIKVTKMTFLIFFYKHFLICNPKLCINQAIKVTKNDF